MECRARTPAATRERLTDRFGRVFDYVRVAVNERCNLRCIYCMPAEGLPFKEGDSLLTAGELERVLGVLAGLGVAKVRFTGGEPLLRADLDQIVERTAAIPGIQSIHLTTNGLLLEKRGRRLREAGLTGLNVSLDTLDAAKFLTITRRAGVEQVLRSIRFAVELGFPSVKVNVVALRGFNDDEIAGFVDLARGAPVTVRFIELMPFDARQVWKRGHFFGADRIVAALREAVPDLEPAVGSSTEEHVFRVPGHAGKVAVIPAYTRSLCAACNRIRVTADGRIRNCLYAADEIDLLGPLRSGAGDEALADLFRRAVAAKAIDGWAAQRAGGDGARASMTQIGG